MKRFNLLKKSLAYTFKYKFFSLDLDLNNSYYHVFAKTVKIKRKYVIKINL